MRLPRLASGSCTPSPRKLRKLSKMIICGIVSVAYTATAPTRFGRMWRAMIAGVPTPSARAASMNSRRLSDSVWARTMRAMVSHPTAPMATNRTARLPRSNRVVRMITMNRYGSEYNTSTKRIIHSSVRPPTYPATEPHVTPITTLTALASRLISSEMRRPCRLRTNRSRPKRSVPSQCEAASCGGTARCPQSRPS